MPSFEKPDVEALGVALDKKPLTSPPSEKGRYFNTVWWPKYHRKVEVPILKAVSRMADPAFDRRVNIMRIIEEVDAANGNDLENRGFSASEKTKYATRATNKRLKSVSDGEQSYFVIRNQKLMRLQLENRPA